MLTGALNLLSCREEKVDLTYTKIPPFFKLNQGDVIGDTLSLKAMKNEGSVNFCFRYFHVDVTTN